MSNLLRPRDVAERLSISLRSVYTLLSSKELPSIRVGEGSVRVTPAALDEYVQQQTKRGTT